MNASPPSAPREAARLGDITPQQRRAGLAAWLGWMFDGLEMHLYTLVATPKKDKDSPVNGTSTSVALLLSDS